MKTSDERSWSLPDGFKRGPEDPDGFTKIDKTTKERFSQSGSQFDGWNQAEALKENDKNIDEEIETALDKASPEIKKLVTGLDFSER